LSRHFQRTADFCAESLRQSALPGATAGRTTDPPRPASLHVVRGGRGRKPPAARRA